MATLITGSGLVATSFAQAAARRNARLVFFDVQPQVEFLKSRVAGASMEVVQGDVLDLSALLEVIMKNRVETIVHTAGLIGTKVATLPTWELRSMSREQ